MVLMGLSGGVSAQNNAEVLKLKLHEKTISVPEVLDARSAMYIDNWPEWNSERYGLVALNSYPTKRDWTILEASGIQYIHYYPEKFVLVAVDKNLGLEALKPYGIMATLPYDADLKGLMNPETAPSRAVTESGTYLVNVHSFPNGAWSKFLNSIENSGIGIVEKRTAYRYVVAEVSSSQLEALSEMPCVWALDWIYDYGEPENYTGRTAHRGNFIGHGNNNGLNYTGEGINVMLQDDGATGPHIDHTGRIGGQYWPISTGDHGDHVGGTIAGAGNLNPNHEGQARGAVLHVYKAAPEYQGFDSVEAHYNSREVVITSTSYSNGCNAGYTSFARRMDEQVQDFPALMHVFSAGNSGTSNCNYGAGQFWGNITGGHKVGKNVITVANLNEQDIVAASSSRGPAHDGRIKPDISAKGTAVTSTIAGNQYDTYTGTSMSCPGVSGTLAQLYEAYKDIHDSLPDGGLMKGIVLNTADDLGNTGPDFIHGWGRINARKAHEAILNGMFIQGEVAHGDSVNHQISVPSGATKLKIMVYWTDAPGATNASVALVNDLDLNVEDPSTNIHLPWVLDHTPNASALAQPATNGVDHLNNVEQVEINIPESGNYEVKISGYNVPQGPQPYFLIYWIEAPEVVLTYPVGGESITPFTTEVIRWDASENMGQLALEYSTDGGNSWNTITNSVPAQQGYVYWSVPFMQTGQAMVKILQNNIELDASTFSVMNVPQGLTVDFVCPDSIGLTWTAINNALSYDIYSLGDKYMDSIGSSNSNAFIHIDADGCASDLWYSVSANGPQNARSKRAVAIQRPEGTFNCPIDQDLDLLTAIPEGSTIYGCAGAEMKVGFVVQNNGDLPITSFTATLDDSSGTQLTQSFSVNLAPQSLDTYFFVQLINLDAGWNDFSLLLQVEGDDNRCNDALSLSYQYVQAELTEPIWEENFDTYSNCSDADNCEGTICEIGGGWTNEPNGTFDDIDWRVHSGATNSTFTGPDGDNTTVQGTGNYIYLEATECFLHTAELISPCVNLGSAQNAKLTFYYHMFGSDMGALHVDVFSDGQWHLDVMPALVGFQSNQWLLREVDLSAFSGEVINVRFRGITGGSFRSDMAIDDIAILHGPVANFEAAPQEDDVTVYFTDLSAYADSITFDLGDGSPLLDTVPFSYIYPSAGLYTVTQVAMNSLGSDTMIKDISTLGMDEVEGGEISIFPNPASDMCEISLGNSGASEIMLYNASGELISKHLVKGDNKLIISLDGFAAGVYFVKTRNENSWMLPLVVAPK